MFAQWCPKHFFIVLIAAIMLSACGGRGTSSSTTVSGSEGGSVSPDDPCSLLTTTEVDNALGVTGAAVSGDDSVNGHGCTWTAHDVNNPDVMVSATIEGNMWTGSGSDFCSEGDIPVSGLGDEACYTKLGSLDLLNFRKGGEGYELQIMANGSFAAMFTKEKVKASEIAMARKVLAKL